MLLPELKTEAKARKIKGFSTMKKAELIAALEAATKPAESFIDGLKATLANDSEARSNKGRKAGNAAPVTRKLHPETKATQYRLQRGSQSARLTKRQSKRVRKAEAKLNNRSRPDGKIYTTVASSYPEFTYA